METRYLTVGDAAAWLPLRAAMWPDDPQDQLQAELAQIAADERQAVIGAFDGGELIGFAELSLHPHAVGCGPGPVAYLEGWYVKPEARRRGVGRRLVEAGLAWAQEQGCTEIASDTWLDNHASDAAHRALGFVEVDRLIHYRKGLGEQGLREQGLKA